jgi:hypothetical protein
MVKAVEMCEMEYKGNREELLSVFNSVHYKQEQEFLHYLHHVAFFQQRPH